MVRFNTWTFEWVILPLIRWYLEKGVDIISTGRNHTDVSSILGKIGAERGYDYIKWCSCTDEAICFIAIVAWKNSSSFTKRHSILQRCMNSYQDEGWFTNKDIVCVSSTKNRDLIIPCWFSKHHGRGTESLFLLQTPEDLVEQKLIYEMFDDVTTMSILH